MATRFAGPPIFPRDKAISKNCATYADTSGAELVAIGDVRVIRIVTLFKCLNGLINSFQPDSILKVVEIEDAWKFVLMHVCS